MMATERIPWWQAVEQRRKTHTGAEITGAGHIERPEDGWDGLCILGRHGPIEAVDDPSIGNADGTIEVQASLPDLRGVVIDAWFLSHGGGHADLLVTTVGEMRGRTDLDQWEYADPWHRSWRPVTGRNSPPVAVPDDLPIVVRRKDGGS